MKPKWMQENRDYDVLDFLYIIAEQWMAVFSPIK